MAFDKSFLRKYIQLNMNNIQNHRNIICLNYQENYICHILPLIRHQHLKQFMAYILLNLLFPEY